MPKREIEKKPEEKISAMEKKKRVVVEDTQPEKIDEWVIYQWLDKDKGVYYAASKINGQLYGKGFEIDKDPEKKDSKEIRHWRARREVTTCIENTLNALAMYGRKVTDQQGNVIPKEVERQERLHSWFGVLRNTRKFPIVEITPQEAKTMKLT